jgi:hypothetical protein
VVRHFNPVVVQVLQDKVVPVVLLRHVQLIRRQEAVVKLPSVGPEQLLAKGAQAEQEHYGLILEITMPVVAQESGIAMVETQEALAAVEMQYPMVKVQEPQELVEVDRVAQGLAQLLMLAVLVDLAQLS